MYTIIEDIYNGWYGVVNDGGEFVTLAADQLGAEQFIEIRELWSRV